MALIGTHRAVAATMRYEENSSDLSWPSYSTDNWLSAGLADAPSDPPARLKSGYECIRTGAWFFFPQKSAANRPAGGAGVVSTFYGWDYDAVTQRDSRLVGANFRGAQADAADAASAWTTTALITGADAGLNFSARCCRSFSLAAGAEVCAKVADRAHAPASGEPVQPAAA